MNSDDSLISQIQGKAPLDLPKQIAELLTLDKLNNKWIIEDIESQQTFEYNEILERWLPQSPNRGSLLSDDGTSSKKRKRSDSDHSQPDNNNNNLHDNNLKPHDDDEENNITKEVNRLKKQKIEQLKAEKQQLKELQRNQNRCVYISHLSKDTTYEDLERTFSKYGIIAIDLNTGQKRIKMYKNHQGNFKGDCLIEYLREESCNLAIDLLDDTLLNPWDGKRISVAKAEFNKEKSKSNNSQSDDSAAKSTTNDKKSKKITYKEKLQRQKRLNDLNRRISNWSDSESDTESASIDQQTTIILRNCFTLEEIEEDPDSILDIKEDIQDGCEELGEVSEVVIYDLEPEGVASVKFKTVQAANECIRKMDGRYFGGQRLKVIKWDGASQFQKSRRS